MIPFRDLKQGDWVRVVYDNQPLEAIIIDVDLDTGQIGTEMPSGMILFFDPENVSGIPLDDIQLNKLRFTKEKTEDGFTKYMHGPFRLLIEKEGDFSHCKIWYREDKRQINYPLMVHQLQNHYREMTNVELTES